MNLTDILTICFQSNLPFFSYRMPRSSDVRTGIQLSTNVAIFCHSLPQSAGFLVAPFDESSSAKCFFIQQDISLLNHTISDADLELIQSAKQTHQSIDDSFYDISKEEYLQQASFLIDKLQQNELRKVVLSRTIHQSDFNIEDAVQIFEKLTHTYPNAFVSLFHIPGVCCWMGATPETLLKAHSHKVETMSLAGTKPAAAEAQWSNKEREEQQMVSDYVATVLNEFPFSEITIEGPQDLVAGNMCHLVTIYTCNGALEAESLFQLIETLHPTPAVCGLPKEQSKLLIHNTEQHDREYYAGYIGPISENGCDLFVNLRCMKLTDDGITLYVGGGITAQSIAEAEWQETCLKAETLLRIIKN
ncbi:MAG: chorismate-binding protein [Bacteroidales bacterium]